MSDQPAPNRPTFDPDSPFQLRPKLRPIRGFPLQANGPDGKPVTMLGLADARQISDKIVATIPQAQAILQYMDGSRTIDEIVEQVGRGLTREFMEHLVAQLDDAALIEGPAFEELKAKVQADFDQADSLPPGATAQFADQLVMQAEGEDATDEAKQEHGPAKLREQFDAWIEQAMKDKAPLESLPKGIVAPHIDYGRGWVNYAAIWGRLRGLTPPDRIVILGTNHFGESSGVCGCDKGFQSPLGSCELDTELVDVLRGTLGDDGGEKLFQHRYDHEREHSIELQIPWIQHAFGARDDGSYPKVFAALIHDPAVNNGESYDGNGLALDPFLDALGATLDQLGGTTLVVSSADLSHAGPAFGDQQRLIGEDGNPDDETAKSFRDNIAKTDQEHLQTFASGKIDELIATMAWQQNPTRWCSVGNMTAAVRLTGTEQIDLVNYSAAIDQQGMSMVSSCAAVLR
mgnify:CR=1 FL=1